tara:strand:- start:2460 stop:4601 length:2142 start_codon:yes stop_codon:yes gene_type:complete
MKWIGQHIWDFISRFRSDVYLENIDSGTIASGGNLGLDSNNKVVKSASPSGSIDLTSEVTGTLPVANGGTGATSLADNSILTGTGTSPITAEANLQFTGNSLGITNRDNDATGPIIFFSNTRNGSDGADDDECGRILFAGMDDGTPSVHNFAEILAEIADASNTDEAGKISIKAAASDGTTTALQQGLTATGHGTNNIVDVGLGYGNTSTTTIAGTLTMGSTAAMTNAGLLSVANQSNITGLGTISSGVWEGTDVGVAHGGTGLSTVGTNEILTGNGTGALTSESSLTYSSETLTIGNDDSGTANIKRLTHGDGAGGNLSIVGGYSTGTNMAGGDVQLIGGVPTGNASWGDIVFYSGIIGSSGTASQGLNMQPIAKVASWGEAENRFYLYEPGAGTDNLTIGVAEHGATTITTTDGAAHAADLTFTVDGKTTFTCADEPGGGDVFHLDADADTDNIVNIDAGVLDVDATASITIDAADDITITAADNATFTGADDVTVSTTSTDGLLTIASNHNAGQAIHIDGNANSGSIVDIDAGILDIDVTGAATLDARTVTITSPNQSKIYDFHSTTFENNYSDDEGSGTIIKYSPGADESPAGSELFFLHTDGTWNQTDADAVATGASQLLGVGLGASARTTGVLLKGFVRIAATEILNVPGSGAVDGLPVYVSTTAGHFDFTAPSGSSDFVRIVGYAIDNDSGVLIYFDPDKTWVEIA